MILLLHENKHSMVQQNCLHCGLPSTSVTCYNCGAHSCYGYGCSITVSEHVDFCPQHIAIMCGCGLMPCGNNQKCLRCMEYHHNIGWYIAQFNINTDFKVTGIPGGNMYYSSMNHFNNNK